MNRQEYENLEKLAAKMSLEELGAALETAIEKFEKAIVGDPK